MYWVILAGIIILGGYALMMTGHYANRTPRQRTALIVIFAVLCTVFLLGPDNLTNLWDSVLNTDRQKN